MDGYGWRMIIVLAICVSPVSVWGHSVSVKTSKGLVEGYTINDVSVFEGIPYAKPPKGEFRFKAPMDADPWSIPLQTKAFRPICPQMMTPYSGQMNIAGPFSEDCLYANVYTPVVHAGPARVAPLLPVMAWIHGGGYIQGSASQTPAPGIVSNLASRDVVVVTFNYRLDVLGFFSTDSDDVPDNIALLDQIAALKWIQNEIRNFGGNPNDVTLFGYSAGASSISAHLYSPLSKGLFAKVILQSGSSFAPWAWSYSDQDSNLRISRETTRKLGCADSLKWSKKEYKKILSCMRAIPTDILIEASWESSTKLGLGWRLTVGGSEGFLPLPPHELAYERRGDIPVMIGTTRDETLLTAAPSVIIYGNGNQSITRSLFTNAVDSLVRIYFKSEEWNTARVLLSHEYGDGELMISNQDSESWLDSTVQMQSGFSFYAPAILEAQLLVESQKAPVFLYSLDYVSDGFPWASSYKGVPHGQDMFYVFSTTAGGLGWTFTKEEREIVDLFGKMWTNFAKSGNPNYPTALNFNWSSLSHKDRWSYLSIDLPHPQMSDEPYHWKAAHIYNNLLPRVLSSLHQRPKEDPLQLRQADQAQTPSSTVFELRTNQFFIATWALLFTLVGVVVIILVFSICHWQGPSGTRDLDRAGYSLQDPTLNKRRRKGKEDKTKGYYPPPQPYPPPFMYNSPLYTVSYPPFPYAYDYQHQTRHMAFPASTLSSSQVAPTRPPTGQQTTKPGGRKSNSGTP